MSNQSLIIEERSRDIGDFLVGRLLPFRKKRMVGPFIFLDHMGPIKMGDGKEMEVNQHPHIGLATLTYLLSGEVQHEDSIGTSQIITPGAINWMVAGKAVTHTERTPVHLHNQPFMMEGYQIWIALPTSHENMEPEFHHLSIDEIPTWTEPGITYRLLAGEAFQKKSPLKIFSPMFMVELLVEETQEINLKGHVFGEIGILINKGAVMACDQRIEEGNLMVAKEEDACQLTVMAGSRIFLIGGQPFDEPRFIDWNFVASEQATIDAAKQAWRSKTFPMMSDDSTSVPYPGD